MRTVRHLVFLGLVGLVFLLPAHAGEKIALVGWGIDAKNLDTCFKDASAVGFDALITWSIEPEFLAKAVAAGEAHGVRVYSSLAPMGRFAALWKKAYPEVPVPWQQMSEKEQAAETFLAAGKNRFITPYQHGGEPTMATEVLLTKIICMSNPEAVQLFEQQLDGILSVKGLAGIGFDGFGYQNYKRCHCPHCEKAFAAYCQKHPELPPKDAEETFFRTMLVEYINHLADYARTKRADAKTTIHIWPVFAPEPLYGNRLNLDFCGQTTAWFTIWPEEKIAEYAKRITGEEKKYHSRQQGVGMIGYYNSPGKFPFKSPEQVDLELRTMIENGCLRIQVCSALHVLRNPDIATVFTKHFGK